MALPAGARVGSYEILAPLGTGGMSEVYRARDLKLGRDVAVKILPPLFAEDPERLKRLEREAKLLAALNHPNIAVIHGLELEEATRFLVLELVPGRTLEERLGGGPLPFPEARDVFLQVARALEAAHEKGIIHRDLKPANVMLTEAGTVKLLDFGLGKEVVPPKARGRTVTFHGPGTSDGIVMGTPAYMSPEQARGLELDKSTDIWSFGVCLFETLTGKNPFARSTLPDTHSAILNDEPPWGTLPVELPQSVETLLKRCLRKRRRDRLHDIGDARIELEEAPASASRSETRRRRRLAAGGLAALGLVILGWWAGTTTTTPPPVGRVERYSIELPATAPLSLDQGEALAASPDGSRLVYAARSQGRGQLFLRPLGELRPVPIPGSDGAFSPFFSPAGDRLAFFADGKLRAVALAGGNPSPLADVASPRGGAWLRRGEEELLVFAPASTGGLEAMSDVRGTPVPLGTLGEEDDRGHRWPAALPGGEAVLVTVWTGSRFDAAALDVATARLERLVEDASYARYAATGSPGHLVFARGTDLHAAPFDPRRRRLLAEPSLVLEDVAFDPRTGASFFELSSTGTLFYAAEDAAAAGGHARLLSVDERGSARPLGESQASIQVPRLSPDGRRVAMTVLDGTATDVWIYDLERGSRTRLTFQGNNGAAVWSPDGATLFFSSDRAGPHSIYRAPSDGSGEARRLTRAEHPQFPTSVSGDGRLLLYAELHPETSFDLWVLTLKDGERRPLLRSEYEEAGGVFSPDGRFIAYSSNESGVEQVYVRRFPETEGRWQISAQQGTEPVWSRGGQQLFFRSGDALMVVSTEAEPDFKASPPRALFEAPFDTAGVLYADYDVTVDGRNFVMIASEQERTAPRIQVVTHWFAELRRRAPGTP